MNNTIKSATKRCALAFCLALIANNAAMAEKAEKPSKQTVHKHKVSPEQHKITASQHYQKPGAAVVISAPPTAKLQAGVQTTLNYRLVSPLAGESMHISVVPDERLQSTVAQQQVHTVEPQGNALSVDILPPEDGVYQVDIFVELDGLTRTLAHRFIIGDALPVQQKSSVFSKDGKRITILPATETIE